MGVSSTPAPAHCDVWWAAPALASPALLELLDDAERARHARFRLPADRDRYAVAHALARLLCAGAADCDPREVTFLLHCGHCDRPEPHGKPRPAGPAAGWEISITHSGERVGVAVSRGPAVGLDVERIAERDLDGLVSYALTERERAVLDAAADHERAPGFFTYWSRKEALLKATGQGLSGGLTSVEVSGPHEAAAVLSWRGPAAPERVWLTDLDAGGDYRAALAVLADGPVTVAVHDASALLRSPHGRPGPRPFAH
ncbi:4'-phosphopantetheinyl transferase superfamily protein [Thermobifida halotolerans]|uniref:4'-phosphopantetheinyl transferase superfamily protein n=1 Tax=Thermobifida halotolerans TaxID=483545 RepID=A0AA97M176_9ACTN|nr:4'-phosphopantetheinyl transferase superfamily protein [Thermobifida halotolerans]UOE21628.1 4'-phosphopantetheinyl transferase superfamily protein [Thermobifida halotolerans]